ncbi:MAG: xanthine/uracil/vitamin C permease, partial [Proteobacteria bacterium]|nr:xanthine/uracil/vitamin C permease [Pseudomonadota bacterium]
MTYPLFSRDDLSGFWALFADNLTNFIIVASVCTFVLKIPADILFGHVFPGLGVSLLIGLSFYAYLARRLAKKEGRTDVTALPYGISTPVLFVYLFGVMLPVYLVTGDGVATWQIGMAAAFIGGVIEAAGAVFGPLVKRITPRAGMLGTLAGIALVYIATVPLAEIVEMPLIGFPAMAIIFVGLVAAARLPFNFPAGLLAIIVGTAIGLATGDAKIDFEGVGVHAPIPVLGDLWAGLKGLAQHPELLAVVLPVEIYNFIETMNNVESAEAAGDEYPVHTCQVMDGVGTMIGAMFGSAFPTTVYIGHPGYKRLGARSGYALMVGIVLFLASILGLVSFLHALIPVAAVAPILVFIGIVMTAQAFQASPRAHGMAVAMAIIPHVSNIIVTKMGGLASAVGTINGEVSLTDPAVVAALAQNGVHITGQTALSQGSIVTGLLWGAMTACVIDLKLRQAALFA